MQLAVRIDAQVAGARVGLAAVAALHRDEAGALHRHVQVAAGLDACAPTESSKPTAELVA